MKKIISVILASIVCILLLAACGNSKSPETTTAAGGNSESNNTDTTAAPEPASETFDVGDFTVDLPEGWKAFPQSDMFGDKDADGNYPIDPSLIYISKEAEDDWDLFSKPYLNIKFNKASTSVWSSRDWYNDVEDFDMTIRGVKCDEAFSGMQTILEGYKDEYMHVAFDDGQFTIQYTIEKDGEATGLSHDDPEVVAILESLTIK